MADKYVFEGNALTGGAEGALDSLNGAAVPDGSHARVDNGTLVYAHVFNSGSSAAENSPFVIVPDAGGGAWELTGVVDKYAVGQNLLTNSGLGVCSNSTLENVPGTSNLVTTWVNDSYDTFTSSGVDITSAIYTTSGDQLASSTISELTEGKLYRIIIAVTLNSGQAPYLRVGTTAGEASSLNVQTANGANTFIFKAGAGADTITMVNNAVANWSATFTLYDATPGFVAADNLGPDGWYKLSGVEVYREHNGANTKDGSFYSAKIIGDGSNDVLYWQFDKRVDASFLSRFKNRTVALGCWVKCSTASKARIYFNDSDGYDPSAYHSGGGSWEWLEISRDIDSAITHLEIALRSGTSTTAYFSQPMLIFGSHIGEGNYSQPVGEVVHLDVADVGLADYDSASVGTGSTSLDIEVQTEGKIPKGFKALSMYMQGAGSQNAYLNLSSKDIYLICDGGKIAGSNMVRDYDHDGFITLSASSTWTGVYINIMGVQVS